MNIRLSMKILVAVILWTVIWPMGVFADCKWEWLCDASGEDCGRAAVCDSVDDVTPPPPPDIRPVVAPSVEPPGTPGVGPAGTSDCKQVRRCDSDGNCIWDTLCLCL